MEIYNKELLNKYREKHLDKPPFFTHPYEDPIYSFLNETLEELTKSNIEGFKKRLKKARNDYNDPLQFYTFLTEIKVAYHLLKYCKQLEFIEKTTSSPDFISDSVYIEVNTPIKQFVTLIKLEKEINKLIPVSCKEKGHKFYFTNLHFQKIIKITLEIAQEIYQNSKAIIENIYENNKIIPIYIELNNEFKGIITNCGYRIHGKGINTINKYLEETLKNKIVRDENNSLKIKNGKFILKNDLNSLHPNILWSELLFLQDFQIAFKELPKNFWENRSLPHDLDSQIISVCGIDSLYDSSQYDKISKELYQQNKSMNWEIPHMLYCLYPNYCKPSKIIILLNKKSKYISPIFDFVKKLFPEINPFLVKLSFEKSLKH